MKNKYLLIPLFLIFSCQLIAPKDEKLIIIEESVKSALEIEDVLNLDKFNIDFSKVKYFDRKSIDEFLKDNTKFTEINDSIAKSELELNKDGFLPKTFIQFEEMEIHGDTIIINMGKYEAIDGACGIKVIFAKKNSKVKLVSSKETWVS